MPGNQVCAIDRPASLYRLRTLSASCTCKRRQLELVKRAQSVFSDWPPDNLDNMRAPSCESSKRLGRVSICRRASAFNLAPARYGPLQVGGRQLAAPPLPEHVSRAAHEKRRRNVNTWPRQHRCRRRRRNSARRRRKQFRAAERLPLAKHLAPLHSPASVFVCAPVSAVFRRRPIGRRVLPRRRRLSRVD